MIGVMGLGTSSLTTSFGSIFGGIDEDDAMAEFDDIRRRLRACELDYLRYQTEKDVIPQKLNKMKGLIDYDDKMYVMITVLETEWRGVCERMRDFQTRQSASSISSIGYSGW